MRNRRPPILIILFRYYFSVLGLCFSVVKLLNPTFNIGLFGLFILNKLSYIYLFLFMNDKLIPIVVRAWLKPKHDCSIKFMNSFSR